MSVDKKRIETNGCDGRTDWEMHRDAASENALRNTGNTT
jgi:hypothetical protein